MKKSEARSQNSGVRIYSLFFCLLCSLFCILSFLGCASAKKTELPAVQIEAIDSNQRGVLAVEAQKYDRALVEFQTALQLNTSVDNQKGIAINLLNLGRLYLLVERYDDAKTTFDKVVNIGTGLNDQFILSEGYASLGRYFYIIGGNNKNAIDNMEMAAAIDRKQGSHTIGNRLNILGMAYKADNKPGDAEKIFNEALQLNKGYAMEADIADSLRGLGDVWIENGDFKKAGYFYENALALDKKLGLSAKISIGLSNLGTLSLRENAPKKALDYFLRAYAVDSSRGNDKRTLKLLDKIIDVYTALEDKNSAEAYSMEKEKLIKKERTKEQ
jgi:tetratricopeptide (TPR) repeat protein